MIVSFLKRAIIVFSGIGISLLLSAFLAPPLLDAIEGIMNVPLPYEGALRFYIAFAWLLFMCGWLLYVLPRGDGRSWVTYAIVSCAYVVTLIIFVWDRSSRLMEEFSWIRYSTTLFLILAALCAFVAGFQQRRGTHTRLSLLWFLLSGGLLYGGLDEVLEIHEKIGKAIEVATGLSHEVTDYVTVSYAAIVLFVVFLCARTVISAYDKNRFALHLFGIGALFYFFSTMFDTFDVVVIKKLTSFAKVLATNPSFVFSDAWYILWSPKNFLNGLEEVFEQTAALLFFVALLLLVIDKLFLSFGRHDVSERRRRVSTVLTLVAGIALFVNGAAAWNALFSARVVKTGSATMIAGPADGLLHADDLEYNEQWGVVVANEGRGNVYQWKDERWVKIPDPNRILKDSDSIALSDTALFVSDGGQGKIFSYKTADGWREIASRNSGLKHPEDLIVREGADGKQETYFVLDESEKSVFVLEQQLLRHGVEKFLALTNIIKPLDPAWVAPEGIADNFVITDDVSGAIFVLNPAEETIERIAQLMKPEDVAALPDGSSIVSDNAWGAVFRIEQDGTTKKIVQFGRPYRDLQGVAVDQHGRLYVITANGFDNTSFMPSFLFRIDGVL